MKIKNFPVIYLIFLRCHSIYYCPLSGQYSSDFKRRVITNKKILSNPPFLTRNHSYGLDCKTILTGLSPKGIKDSKDLFARYEYLSVRNSTFK